MFVVAQGVVMFAAAGSFAWPGGWAFLVLIGASTLAVSLWLARYDPALLATRLEPFYKSPQPAWDRVLMIMISVLWFVWLGLMGLDAVRFGWSSVSWPWQILGGCGLVAGFFVAYLVFRVNSFAAIVVTIQHQRAHEVVSSGPYRLVRHPLYTGTIPIFVGVPLLLGSLYGLLILVIVMPMIVVRCVLEERVLQEGLSGYDAYARRVRYRLIPGVW